MREKIRTTRMMAFLLALAMVLCAVYMDGRRNQASAEEEQKTGYYSAYVPEHYENDEALAAKQVTFNGIKWYIIEDNSTAENEGTLTLLTVDSLEKSKFGSDNKYARSFVDNWLRDYYDNNFGEVDFAVNSVVLSDISPNYSSKLYLLSYEEAYDLELVIPPIRSSFVSGSFEGYWWLRSPDPSNNKKVSCVPFSLSPYYMDLSLYEFDIRPALQLNLSAVDFLSETNTFRVGCSVEVTGGANTTISGGDIRQTNLFDKMTDLTFTANSGFHFEAFDNITEKEITVKRLSDTVVTVSGTPTGNVSIWVPDAVRNTYDGDPYISYVGRATTVKFNNLDWYILEDNSTSEYSGSLTLLAKDSFCELQFHDSDKDYKTSNVKSYLDGLTAENGSFAAVTGAIKSVDLSDVGVIGAKLYLLSKDEAEKITNNSIKKIRDESCEGGYGWWWLRSETEDEELDVYAVADSGELSRAFNIHVFSVRPALQLDLSAVVFSPESGEFTMAVPITGLALDKTEKQKVKVDDKVSFTANFSPANASYKTVKWHVDKKNVKLYSNKACTTEVGTGETTVLTVYAKGVKIGNDTITVTSCKDTNMSASCDITVEKRYSWEWVDGKWYEKDGSQSYQSLGSWKKDGTDWMYVDKSGWYAKNCWQKIDFKWYFFDRKGHMVKDVYQKGITGRIWYVTKNGTWDGNDALIGWKKDSRGWWFALYGTDYLKNTWEIINGDRYYFKANGYAARNEFVKGYWFNDNCTQTDTKVYSWHKDKKGWWYGINGGWYAKDKSFIIDGKEYSFDKKGYCVNP